MLFRFSRRKRARGDPHVRDRRDAGIDHTNPPQSRELREWRRSAQRVTRAWNAWLAADRRDRGVRYRALVAALADEERAATEVERMSELAEAGTA